VGINLDSFVTVDTREYVDAVLISFESTPRKLTGVEHFFAAGHRMLGISSLSSFTLLLSPTRWQRLSG
jgi:hypothetical protein